MEKFNFCMLHQNDLKTDIFLNMLQRIKIHLVAFDEAHCISKWGHDFRPSYQNVISKVFTLPQDFTIIALTATARLKYSKILEKS